MKEKKGAIVLIILIIFAIGIDIFLIYNKNTKSENNHETQESTGEKITVLYSCESDEKKQTLENGNTHTYCFVYEFFVNEDKIEEGIHKEIINFSNKEDYDLFNMNHPQKENLEKIETPENLEITFSKGMIMNFDNSKENTFSKEYLEKLKEKGFICKSENS